jgi:hypothetical protein
VLALGAVPAGCGGSDGDRQPAAPPPAPRLALLAAARGPGEIVLRGDTAPAERGPFAFEGRYRVRFEQVAPEDPRLDFGGQTPFVALLRPEAGPGRTVSLFRAARATGDRTLAIRGRYVVEVSFGDFPYALRITPAP